MVDTVCSLIALDADRRIWHLQLPANWDVFHLLWSSNSHVTLSVAGACEGSLMNDESRWDSVRKGICCECRDNNIDSLLYR